MSSTIEAVRHFAERTPLRIAVRCAIRVFDIP
jgi:hypothetical protein